MIKGILEGLVKASDNNVNPKIGMFNRDCSSVSIEKIEKLVINIDKLIVCDEGAADKITEAVSRQVSPVEVQEMDAEKQ